MNQRTHKTIAAVLNLAVVLGSFEGLIAILNLDQPALYIKTAFIVGLFFILQIILLYDLHYKNRGSLVRARAKHQSVANSFVKGCKVLGSALWDRCAHLRQWNFIKRWLNYLILPGMLFWGTISVFFLNFGFWKIQQIFVLLSSVAIFLNYWYLKEIFSRAKEIVDNDVFVMLSVVKVYAGCLVFGASLALIRYYCLDGGLLVSGIFCLAFLLIYQALFQHRMVNVRTIGVTLLIAFIMACVGYFALVFWGYNYFTAGIFLGACFNLLWAVFHYHLDRSLTWQAFWEILVISLIIAGMVLSITNFKAKILDSCSYHFGRLNTED